MKLLTASWPLTVVSTQVYWTSVKCNEDALVSLLDLSCVIQEAQWNLWASSLLLLCRNGMKKYFCVVWRSAEVWFKDSQFDFRLVIMLLMEDLTPRGCFFIFAWKLTVLSSSPLRAAEIINQRDPALMKYFDSRGTSMYDKMLCWIRHSSVSFARGAEWAGAKEKMDLSYWVFFVEANAFSAVLQSKSLLKRCRLPYREVDGFEQHVLE